jgi:hypothetical protein
VEQILQLFLQVCGPAPSFRGFECVSWLVRNHSEFIHQGCGSVGIVEGKRVSREGYLLGGNSRAGNPVPHDDPASRPCYSHHLLGHLKRPGRKHRSKDAQHEIKILILQVMQIRCVAFLKFAIRETLVLGTSVSGVNLISRDTDTQHIRPEPGCR